MLMISKHLKGFTFRQNELNLQKTRFAVYINAVHFSTSNLLSFFPFVLLLGFSEFVTCLMFF